MATTTTETPRAHSRSERGIGARMAKSQDLITLLAGFSPVYQPTNADLTVANLQSLHDAAQSAQAAVVTAQSDEKVAQEARKKLFVKAGRGVQGRLADIGKTVLANYGKGSAQYSQVAALIEQMRGDGGTAPAGEGSGVSQSQTSYASVTSAYTDLINLVTSFGANYSPAVDDIKVTALNTHLSAIEAANAAATNKSLAARAAEDARNTAITTLVDRLLRAKAAVSAQYGYNSPQDKEARKRKLWKDKNIEITPLQAGPPPAGGGGGGGGD